MCLCIQECSYIAHRLKYRYSQSTQVNTQLGTLYNTKTWLEKKSQEESHQEERIVDSHVLKLLV